MADRVKVFGSASRTTSSFSNDITNNYGDSLVAILNVTAFSSTPSVVFTIQGKDEGSGEYYDILTSAAVVTSGTTVFRVFPGAVPATNLTVNDLLPGVWRVRAIHGDADPITYSMTGVMV